MTGDEIINLARIHYGEETPNVVSSDSAKSFLNSAIMELYEDLPAERKKNLITTDTVSLTSGSGIIDDTWDKVLEVYANGVPAYLVSREVIYNSAYGQQNLFESVVPIFYIDDTQVWVRPDNATVDVVHIDPPVPIANFEGEVTAFDEQWHPALAFLVASYMYAQEEDVVQAQHYRAEYQQRLTSVTASVGEE